MKLGSNNEVIYTDSLKDATGTLYGLDSNLQQTAVLDETDPIFRASPAFGIAATDIANWNTPVYIQLGYLPEDPANKSSSISNDYPSDTMYASVTAVKNYADSVASSILSYRGGYDASTGSYPNDNGSGAGGQIVAGNSWLITVAGTLDGGDVYLGDFVVSKTTDPTDSSVDWDILHTGIGYVPEDPSNKVTSIDEFSTDIQYPSAKLLYDQLSSYYNYESWNIYINDEVGYNVLNRYSLRLNNSDFISWSLNTDTPELYDITATIDLSSKQDVFEYQSDNKFYAAPTGGGIPEFRYITYDDIASILPTSASPFTIENTESLFSTGLYLCGNGSTANYSIFIGRYSGSGSAGNNNVFIGDASGLSSSTIYSGTFLGERSGGYALQSNESVFIGSMAGYEASNSIRSVFIGPNSGHLASTSSHSNFIGSSAGEGSQGSNFSNFIGYDAGRDSDSLNYSNLIGYKAGAFFLGNYIGSGNTIIGTNITLPNGSVNSLNIGATIFAKEMWGNPAGNPIIYAASTSKVGIGVVSPSARLHLPSGAITAGLAPLKFTTGPLTTVPEIGAVEFLNDALYITISSGAARKQIAFYNGTSGTFVSADSKVITVTNGLITSIV